MDKKRTSIAALGNTDSPLVKKKARISSAASRKIRSGKSSEEAYESQLRDLMEEEAASAKESESWLLELIEEDELFDELSVLVRNPF